MDNLKIKKKLLLSKYSILFCLRCSQLIRIKSISVLHKTVQVVIKCECHSNYNRILLQDLINNYCYSFSDLAVRGNHINILYNNNWIKINLNNNSKNKIECHCKNQHDNCYLYCKDCEHFVCDQCNQSHSFHNLFLYRQGVFLSKKNLNKLEKYCYHSYTEIKKTNDKAKSIFKNLLKSNSQYFDIIADKIRYNDEINKSLFNLFHLIRNTFKMVQTLPNYLNLSIFSYYNKPCELPIITKKDYRKRKMFIENFIKQCESNFLIPIISNYKTFELVKELKLYGKRHYDVISGKLVKFNSLQIFKLKSKEKKKYLRGEILDSKLQYSSIEKERQNLENTISPLRVKKIIVLDDHRLAIQYCYICTIGIYSFNIKKQNFSFKFAIEFSDDIELSIKFRDSKLGIIENKNRLWIVKINQKDYEKQICEITSIKYCIELNSSTILLFNGAGMYIVENGLENINHNDRIEYFANCTFCFRISDNEALINRGNEVFILKINKTIEVMTVFFAQIFNNLSICSMNKKIIYCQTGTHIILINFETLQIVSVYQTFHFLFYQLDYPKQDLMESFFKFINYDTKKLSSHMKLRGYKDIFQIAPNLFLVSTPKSLYWYTMY